MKKLNFVLVGAMIHENKEFRTIERAPCIDMVIILIFFDLLSRKNKIYPKFKNKIGDFERFHQRLLQNTGFFVYIQYTGYNIVYAQLA